MKEIWLLHFLYKIIKTGSFHDAINSIHMELKTDHFSFMIPCVKLWYIVPYVWIKRYHFVSNREVISKIFSKKSTRLSWFNTIFNTALLSNCTINGIETSSPYFRHIHNGLKQAVLSQIDNPEFESNLLSHFGKIMPGNSKDMNSIVKNTVVPFWSKFVFGSSILPHEYEKLHLDVVSYFRNTFYNTSTQRIYGIGHFNSFVRALIFHRCKCKIMNRIGKLIDKCTESNEMCFVNNLDKNLKDVYPSSYEFKKKIRSYMIHNIILTFLVYDFIHNLVHHMIALRATMPDKEFFELAREQLVSNNMETIFKKSVKAAFLYPRRIRVIGENIDLNILKDDTVVVNLLDAELYFSTGLRGCIGYPLIKRIVPKFLKALINCYIKLSDSSDRIVVNSNIDTPFIVSNNSVNIIPRDIRDEIRCVKYTNSNLETINFYDVLSLLHMKNLMQNARRVIEDNINPSSFDIVVSTEARGIPFGQFICDIFNKPHIIIRKEGGYKGDVLIHSYKRGYNTDIQTIVLPNYYMDYIKGKRVCLVDDGFASGGTVVAASHLLNKFNADIMVIVSFVQHTYCSDEQINKVFREKYLEKTLFIYRL